MLIILALIGLVIVVLVGVRIARRKKRPGAFSLRDVGTIIDRSISAYRRHLLPTLILSALCLPLGTSSRFSLSLLGGRYPFAFSSTPSVSSEPLLFLIGALSLLSAFGIGQTLLAYGVAAGMRAERLGQPVTLGGLIPRQRPLALLGLVLLMIIPAILSTLVGIFGMLFAVLWAVAPAVLLHEGLGPWAAVKRSFAIVRPHYSTLLNTLVPLWLIGWLVVGTPLFAGLWLLDLLGVVSDTVTTTLLFCAWVVGQVCVAPVMAFGAVCFYLYVQEHTAPPVAPPEAAPTWEAFESEYHPS
jgi:hypothetical protein